MEIELKGNWIEIKLYNTDLSTHSGERRMDTIGMDITSFQRFGGTEKIIEAHLYPEDIENLKIALDSVLKDALWCRKNYHRNRVSKEVEGEITTLIRPDEGGDLIYQECLKEMKKKYRELFRTGEWFEIPRNKTGVADTWGLHEVFEEFMPFLVWNSETRRPEFVDESWRDTNLYHDISWNHWKYTKLRGIV